MAKRNRGDGISLDSFLDILTCLQGVLMLIIITTGIDAAQTKVLVKTPLNLSGNFRPIYVECRNQQLFNVKPQAIRDIVISGGMDLPVQVLDAHSGKTIASYPVGEGGFVRGSLRALSRMRFVAKTDESVPYRLIRWENGAISLSDTASVERLILNAFGPDNAAAFAALLDAKVQ